MTSATWRVLTNRLRSVHRQRSRMVSAAIQAIRNPAPGARLTSTRAYAPAEASPFRPQKLKFAIALASSVSESFNPQLRSGADADYFNLPSKTARQRALRSALLRCRQRVIAVRSGMNSLQRRNTSGLQALRCANVSSSAPANPEVAVKKATATTIRVPIKTVETSRRSRFAVRGFITIDYVVSGPQSGFANARRSSS